MNFGRQSLVLGLVLAGIFGCDDGGGETGRQEEADTMRRVRPQDVGVTPDEGTDPRPDGGEPADAAPPDGAADAAIRNVAGCEDACRVYGACGRTDDLWGGDAGNCLAACEDAQESPRFASYIACLQVTACDRLDECTVPEKPLPTCERVCTAIEGCDAEFRLPSGHPDFADCAAACADGQVTRFMSECGVDLPDTAPDACDEPAFGRCLLGHIGVECLALCDKRALCEDADDPIDCALDCLQNPAAPDEDPVAQRRAEQAATCLFNAETCDDVQACEAREVPVVDQATVDAICAANAECAFFPADTCPEAVTELLPKLGDDAGACLLSGLTEGCDAPIYDCFAVPTLAGAECEELCLVQDLCGLLPNDQNEFLCLEACQGAIRDALPGAATYRRQFPCAFRDACEAVEACLATAAPGAVCLDVCSTELECQHPGDAECVDDCEQHFDSVRVRAETTCVQAAVGCEAQARCITPEPADCGLLCDAAAACGVDAADCALTCDDAAFADRAGFAAQVACVQSSARCSDVQACLEGPPARGAECLAWCRSAANCADDDPTAYEQCVADCGLSSPGGLDGVIFEGARACLADLGAAGACAAYDQCIDEADQDDTCPRFCAEQARCGLVEDDAACAEDCNGAVGGQVYGPASCVFNAMRRRAGCAPVAECVDAEVEPADADCAALCAAQQACDEEVDRFLCERECTPSPEGTALRAVCAGLAECDTLQTCLDADAAPPAGCADVCDAIGACDGLIGEGAGALFADVDACLATCGGTAVLEAPEFVGQLGMCVQGAMCDAEQITGCFDSPDGLCQEAWDALVVCNSQAVIGGGNEAQFLADCRMNIQMGGDPARMSAQCLIDAAAMGDPASCLIDQIFCALQ